MIEPMVQKFNCSRCSRSLDPCRPHVTPHVAEASRIKGVFFNKGLDVPCM